MINHQVVAIPSDKDSLIDALGISESRRDEIIKHFFSIKNNEKIKSFSEQLEEATSISKNINETAYIAFLTGADAAEVKSMSYVLKILNSFKGLSSRAVKIPMDIVPKDFLEFLKRMAEEDDE